MVVTNWIILDNNSCHVPCTARICYRILAYFAELYEEGVCGLYISKGQLSQDIESRTYSIFYHVVQRSS